MKLKPPVVRIHFEFNRNMNTIKRILFILLSERLFLATLQRVYWAMYRAGLLKKSEVFKYHYFIQKVIQPTDYIVDIGANLGYFSMPFSWLSRAGRVDAIEPLPMYADALKRVFKRNSRVFIHNIALGAMDGSVVMELPYEQGVLRTGLPHIVSQPDASCTEGRRLNVLMKRTDKFFKKFEKIDYLKCDVEGYEWEIFKSLEATLIRTRPVVQVEISGPNVANMCALMKKLGFAQYGLMQGRCVPDEVPQKSEGDFLFIPHEKEHLVSLWNN